jgi:serine/threonine protein kinase
MLERKKLTKFQADLIFKGKLKRLVVGNYIVVERIGQGGMGRVYKARHRRMDRIVALKLLPFAARQSPEAISRFDREIRAAARLTHPNIVTAHDADEAEGRYYLVMEYIDGVDLLTLVRKKGPLSVRRAVNYILQAGEGLAYAHDQKVIHLDIKPANLLLDKSGTVKVLDMGLARIDDLVGEIEDEPAEELIQDGKVMGTVDYICPERSTNPEAVDHRADIYSLGCTLFHVLTGRPPYTGSTILKRIEAHRLQPIPSLRKYRRDVPKGLDAAYQRMMAKAPEDRQSSMREVIAELQPYAERAAADSDEAKKS